VTIEGNSNVFVRKIISKRLQPVVFVNRVNMFPQEHQGKFMVVDTKDLRKISSSAQFEISNEKLQTYLPGNILSVCSMVVGVLEGAMQLFIGTRTVITRCSFASDIANNVLP
jgi:hypothetical protein